MFCGKCGKEIKEDMRFCPGCGAKVDFVEEEGDAGAGGVPEGEGDGGFPAGENAKRKDKPQQDRDNRQSVPGIEIRGDFAEFAQIAERVREGEKRWSIIGKVLGVCALLLIGWETLKTIGPILEGEMFVLYPVALALAVVLVSCGAVYMFLKATLPGVEKRKKSLAEAYLGQISVRDKQALFLAVSQISCAAIKGVYQDEKGDVCVQGKRCKHTLLVNPDGVPVIQSEKDGYKAILERETIAGWLLKSLSPDAPVNAFENGRYNARLSRMNGILAVVAAASLGIFAVISFTYPDLMTSGGTHPYISMVQNGHPESYPDISYGRAFRHFFEDCRWRYFDSEDQDIVEFRGNCMLDGKKAEVAVQFLVEYEKGTFRLFAAAIDNEPQTTLANGLLMLSIFENYGSENGRGTLSEEDLGDADEALGDDVSSGEESGNSKDAALANEAAEDMDAFAEDSYASVSRETLPGSYSRESGPKCGFSIWSADDNGIFFALAIGSSGYRAYVDMRDCTAAWVDENTAVYTEEYGDRHYSLTFAVQEDGSMVLSENVPYSEDFPLAGFYIPDAMAEGDCEWVFPEIVIAPIEASELEGKTAAECKIARNEIYAAHGRRFNDEQLQGYFETCSWYQGTIAPEAFSDSVLSEVEKKNLQIISEYEAKMGY